MSAKSRPTYLARKIFLWNSKNIKLLEKKYMIVLPEQHERPTPVFKSCMVVILLYKFGGISIII